MAGTVKIHEYYVPLNKGVNIMQTKDTEVPLRRSIARSIYLWMLAVILFAASGCTTVKTFQVKEAFPVAGLAHTSGPEVTVLPVEEMLDESEDIAAFKTDPTHLGKGVRGFGMIFLLPYFIESDEFHSDAARTDTISSATLSRLNGKGVPAVYLAKGGIEQIKQLPEDRLAISIRLRKFNVDSDFNGLLPFIAFNLVMFTDTVAEATLDCQLLQPGKTTPLWQGTVESRREAGRTIEVAGMAVSDAVDQCIAKSGLMETRSKLATQRYEKLMAGGREVEQTGDSVKALMMYGQAYGSAMTPDGEHDAISAMALLLRALPAMPELPEDARKFKVQAERAVQQKKFIDAADLYSRAINIAPWWPGGHFNRALVLGETETYNTAMQEMKYYLQLSPNAPNARAAQDKIYDWERLNTK